MRDTCDNCGRAVLPTDTICWHCGQPLPAEPSPSPEDRSQAGEKGANEAGAGANGTAASSPRPSRSLLLAYGSLTLVIFIAMLWVMGALGKYPLLVVNPDTRGGANWDIVEGDNGHYQVSLPEDWRRWQADDAGFQDELASDSRYRAALFPLGAIAEDTDYLLLALTNHHSAAEAPGFLAVGRSDRLGRAPLPQVIELVQQSPAISIRRAEIEPGLTGRDQVQLELDFARDGNTWRCRQWVIPARETTFLLGTCALPNDFIRYEDHFADLLLSFQPLQ
jgi:hypothetical protein